MHSRLAQRRFRSFFITGHGHGVVTEWQTGSSLGRAQAHPGSLCAFPSQSCAVNELCCGVLRSASSEGSRTQVGDLDVAA